MSVRVLYFASLRDATGMPSEDMDYSGSVSDLFDTLRERYALRWQRTQLRVSINGAFVDWDSALKDGDEVVFLPPMSGG